MAGVYPEHPVTYRRETVELLFRLLQAGESCVVVGAASVAKSNLVRFLLRSDVQQHYALTEAQRLLMILADTNRLVEMSEWAGYELMLSSIVMDSGSLGENDDIAEQLGELHHRTVLSKDRLLAQRNVERAFRLLCRECGLRLVVLMDEADQFYSTVDKRFLHNLRAFRDDNKYQLCYLLLTRAPLDRLRNPAECEGFYELFSRNTLGLKPYRFSDAQRVVLQLEARKGHTLAESERELLVHASGGHPGLIVAAFDALVRREDRKLVDSPAWFWLVDSVKDECYKLWRSLADDEQWALIRITAGFCDQDLSQAEELLALKGLLASDETVHWRVFSPLFELWVKQSGEQGAHGFRVDKATASVWVSGRRISNLTRLEFALVDLLYEHRDKVQSRDTILKTLYPHEFRDDHDPEVQDNRVDTLVRRLRIKIEPEPSQPRYVVTVRGHGYKLASGSEPEQD